jgi:ATP-dependent RNA helicase DeaD
VLLAPFSKERKLVRLLRDAGVDADWRPAPGADEVRRVLAKRARRALSDLVDGAADVAGDAGDERLELAQMLLAGREPERVVAALLARVDVGARVEPKEVVALQGRVRHAGRGAAAERAGSARGAAGGPPRRAGDARTLLRAVAAEHAGEERAGGRRRERPEQRERLDGPERDELRPRAAGAPTEGYERFTLNWGSANGASPQRVLAHVCRRGGVTSREVGAIRLAAQSCTFEIRRHAAGAFAARASRRDARDPKLVVRRLTGCA